MSSYEYPTNRRNFWPKVWPPKTCNCQPNMLDSTHEQKADPPTEAKGIYRARSESSAWIDYWASSFSPRLPSQAQARCACIRLLIPLSYPPAKVLTWLRHRTFLLPAHDGAAMALFLLIFLTMSGMVGNAILVMPHGTVRVLLFSKVGIFPRKITEYAHIVRPLC